VRIDRELSASIVFLCPCLLLSRPTSEFPILVEPMISFYNSGKPIRRRSMAIRARYGPIDEVLINSLAVAMQQVSVVYLLLGQVFQPVTTYPPTPG